DLHQHQQHDRRVAPGPAQLRHDIEVHAVDPGDEGQRHEQRGKDGQHLHDFVGALADVGQIQVQQTDQQLADGIYAVHDVNDVIVDIPQVQESLLGNQRAVVPSQAAEQLAQWPDGLAQQQHLGLVVVELRQGILSGAGDDLVFQFLYSLAQVFEHFEVMVHHRVQQRIGQIVAAHEADAPPRAQALTHSVEHIPCALLEGQHEIPAQYQADLLGLDLLVLAIELQHAQHYVQIARVLLDLGALIGIEHIFQNQRMQLELTAERLDHTGIGHPVHIQPADLARHLRRPVAGGV